jgi:ubiquinone/menaquinone biosynthesis C-methylase UbiE
MKRIQVILVDLLPANPINYLCCAACVYAAPERRLMHPTNSMDNSSANKSSSIPAEEAAIHYDRFFGPFYFEPYAIEVAKKIVPEKIAVALEIAAGTGRVTRHIRQRIPPAATLIASDISEEMLAVAIQQLNDPDIEWRNIDAQQLPFADNSIDLVICCFGYMFVPDKSKAFAEAYRVLKPGGQFLFTTWDQLERNAASHCARTIAASFLEKPFPASADLATSMHDETAIAALLETARFSSITIERKQLLSVSPTAGEAAEGLLKGGVYDDINKDRPDILPEIRMRLEKELAEKFGNAPMVSPMSAVICEVWK